MYINLTFKRLLIGLVVVPFLAATISCKNASSISVTRNSDAADASKFGNKPVSISSTATTVSQGKGST